MSLWSPVVDLVNGSGKKQNLTNGNSQNYQEMLGQLNAKFIASQLQQSNLSEDDKAALYNQLLQNSLQNKNRLLNPSSELDNASNNQQTNRNRNINDNQRARNANNNNQSKGMPNNKSNQRNNQSGSGMGQSNMASSSNNNSTKRSNNLLDQQLVEQLFNQNAKKMKTNHQQANPQVQALQQQIQLQLAQHQLNTQQKLELQQQQQLQKQLEQQKQILKQFQKQQQANVKKNEVNKNQQNLLLNQQALALALTGGDVPLDLCVNNSNNKKSELTAYLTNQIRQKQMLANLTGNNLGMNNVSNNDLISQLDNEQVMELLLRQKRGRKPKSSTQTSESLIQQPSSSTSFNQQQTSNASSSNFDLLNNFNSTRESPINQASSLLVDNRPRKRGRPSSTSTSNLSNSNQQNHQNNNTNINNNNNINHNQLAQILSLIQAKPELVNMPAFRQILLPILPFLQNLNNSNNRNNNTINNNGINQQDLIQQAQNTLLQQQFNQLKAMQAKFLLSQASSNNRQQQQTSSSSIATQHQKNKNLNDNNLSHLSTGNVVIEEIKQRDHLDSEESDLDANLEISGKDQITFIRNYDERNLRIVFPFGWRRQTILKSVSKSGVRGEVFYISPCGKKFKNFSEVDKYLMKSNKNNLRKEHFNFSSRIVIGEFLEQLSDKNNDFKIYNENEIINRIESIRRSALKKSTSNTAMSTSSSNTSTMNRKELNNQLATSISSSNKKPAAINHNNSAMIEANNKANLEMEKNRQLAEAKLKEELQRQKKAKEEEAKRLLEQQKEQELKRKKELALQAELEKERRKQNQVLVKILESNRRILDRDKKLTSFTNERRLQQDRRNLKKRIESEIQKEIKKPVEDMMLKDLDNLQTLNRIPGLKLAGKAFADLLMIYEFLNNFYECINLDRDRIPTLNTLQSALLNLDEAAEIEMMEILQHLLTIAIDDPGVPYNVNTLVGQKLKDITINSLNISEVLRMYFQSYVSQIREDSLLDRVEYKIFNILNTGKPYLSLNASIKVEILAFICNELLCNQSITKKIEDRIESASNVKRDKWVIENDLRKYKLLKVKREKREDEIAEEKARNAENKNKENADKDEEDSDSDHDSQVYGNEIDGEDQLTNAEIDKNIEKLTKSVNNQSNKLNKIVNSYRVTSFGQDRFRRRYWSLPNAGAVFVESMESCEIEENLKLLEEEEHQNEELEDEEMDDEEEEKMEIEETKETTNKEIEDTRDVEEIKEEITKVKEEIVKEEKIEDLILSSTRSSRSSTRRKNDHEQQLQQNDKDEHKTDKVKSEEEIKNEENNQNISVEDKKENGENQLDEQEIKSEMPNYMDLLNSEWIQSIIENVYSNYPSQNNFSSTSLVKKTTVLAGLEFLIQNQQQQTRQVFNILPRTSCSVNIPDQLPDFSSMINSKDEESKINQMNDDKLQQQQDLNLYKINDAIILPQELDIDATLQSQLIELKKLEYNRPKRIDDEYRYGWWNITDTSQLRQVAESMHERAHRERNLKKHILKYFNNLAAKIRQNNVEFDITDLDRIISIKCPFGAPVQPDEEWCEDTALKLDILVLEMVENLEETISQSSMQIRNWKPMPRTENDREFICYPLYGAPKPDDLDLSIDDISNTADNSTENNGYASANHLQINNPILIARERLLAAEAGIERRYLKPPLGFKSNTILLSSGNDEYADNANDENAPSGLIRWREAVRVCDSGTQLALLLHFLESFIAWDKSIMRASCQFCNSGENEAELLLCDSCDKGYHLYCFRPKMETIPEGDWFCYECLNKNSMDKVCVICGKKGKLINCDTCPKVFHPNCLDPPVSKPQKGRWFCFACLRKSKKPMKSTPSERQKGNSKSNIEKSIECKTPNEKSKNEINHQNTSKSNSTTKDSKKKSNKKAPAVAKETEKNQKSHAKDNIKDHDKEREKDHDQTLNDKDNSTTTTKETTNSGKKDSKKKESRTSETKEKKNSKETKSKAEPKEITSTSKDRSKKKSAKELGTSILLEPKKDNYNPSPFELLLDDIVQHKDSWPFLNPVDTNEYPLYKNIIKKPMDFAKIKQKNDAGQYTDSELFIADCRLIFDNCETFNEDESEVVKAGRNLREFIENRWKELID